MQQKIQTLTPPQDTRTAPAGDALGFQADTVRVDNPTPYYWYLPDELRYIPPFSSGIVVRLHSPTFTGRVYLQAPTNVTQPSVQTPGGLLTSSPTTPSATFIWTDESAPSSPGVGINGGQQVTTANVPQRFSAPLLGTVQFPNPFSSYDVFPTPAPYGIALEIADNAARPTNVSGTLLVVLSLPNGLAFFYKTYYITLRGFTQSTLNLQQTIYIPVPIPANAGMYLLWTPLSGSGAGPVVRIYQGRWAADENPYLGYTGAGTAGLLRSGETHYICLEGIYQLFLRLYFTVNGGVHTFSIGNIDPIMDVDGFVQPDIANQVAVAGFNVATLVLSRGANFSQATATAVPAPGAWNATPPMGANIYLQNVVGPNAIAYTYTAYRQK